VNERTPLRSAGRLRRAVTVALLALIGTIGLAGLLPGTALAENSLVSSDPADGSTLSASPESISFTFSEPLGEVNTITLTCTDLYTVGPREVSADRLTMTAEVIDPLPKGACVASFVVSDEEGSPNGQGNITFTIENDPATVETTTAPEETTGESVPTGEVSTTAATTTGDVADLSDVDSGQGPLWLGRLLSVFGIAVLLGSLVLIAAAWPEGVEYLVTIRFIRAIWVVALIGTLLYVAAATAAVTGSGLGSGFNPANWVDLFDAGLPGIAAVARFVLVVASGWVAFRPDRVIDPVTQMAALGIPALAVATVGFSRTNMDLAIVGVPLSIIHALAMSVWLGGVVLLARVVLAGPGEEDLVHAVRGFARLSNLAIGATIVTGIVQMILLDGGDLFGTSHGRVLLLKTVAVAGMIFVAVSARQFVNQRLARANEMTVPMADRLRRAFGVEAAAGVIVLAMSAWLLTLTPSNVSAGPDIDYAITLEVDAPEAELAVTVQLTRDRVGLSGMSVEVDEPDEGLSGLEVVFTAPANDTIGTITQPVPLTGAGVAVLLEGDQGLPLTVAGDWTMTVNAVTPTGVFTSPPQGFTILNADGTEAVTALTVPPAVNVTIPPLTTEP
jgi:copper transport protein